MNSVQQSLRNFTDINRSPVANVVKAGARKVVEGTKAAAKRAAPYALASTVAVSPLLHSEPVEAGDKPSPFAAVKSSTTPQENSNKQILQDDIQVRFAKFLEINHLSSDKVHQEFFNPAYKQNLEYVLKKLPIAKQDGLKNTNLQDIFSLHPVTAHTLVRSTYITYQDIPVLNVHDVSGILNNAEVTNFGKEGNLTEKKIQEFVSNFVANYVIPNMKINLAYAHDKTGEPYDQAEIDRETMYGYNKSYKKGFDEIASITTIANNLVFRN